MPRSWLHMLCRSGSLHVTSARLPARFCSHMDTPHKQKERQRDRETETATSGAARRAGRSGGQAHLDHHVGGGLHGVVWLEEEVLEDELARRDARDRHAPLHHRRDDVLDRLPTERESEHERERDRERKPQHAACRRARGSRGVGT
eukprot:685584-Rhodomonas_salina.1